MTVLRTEREVVKRCCVFMSKGLTASKFSHDVSGPATVLRSCVTELQKLVEPDSGPAPGPALEAMRHLVDDAAEASDEILRMTRMLAQSVRTPETAAASTVRELLSEGLEAARRDLTVHAAGLEELHLEVEDATVWVTEGHASTLGNLIANAVLERPEAPLDLRGERASDAYYHLTIRDRGVAPGERGQALLRVREALSFDARAPDLSPPGGLSPRDGRQEGYGIALMMARVFLLHHGGWIDVSEPEEGHGLVLHVLLPMCPPDQIDQTSDRPEAYVDGGFIGMAR